MEGWKIGRMDDMHLFHPSIPDYHAKPDFASLIFSNMNLDRLAKKDILLIELLGGTGSMTLSELSAQMLTPPSKTLKIIEHLQRKGYIGIAPVEEGSENKSYFLNSNGRKLYAVLR